MHAWFAMPHAMLATPVAAMPCLHKARGLGGPCCANHYAVPAMRAMQCHAMLERQSVQCHDMPASFQALPCHVMPASCQALPCRATPCMP